MKTCQPAPVPSCFRYPAAIALLLAILPAVQALPATWDGAGSDNKWQTINNFTGGNGTGGSPAAGDTLIFTGDTQNSTNNDSAAATIFAGISFTNDGTSGKTNAFTLAGNSITLTTANTGIVTTAVTTGSITDTISLNLSLTANVNINPGLGHNLIISGAILNGSASRQLIKQGAGELILQNAGNTYAGKTSLNAGILTVDVVGGIANAGTPCALGNGTVGVNSSLTFGGGTLNVKSGAASTDRQVDFAGGSGTITNNTPNGSGALVFSNAAFNIAGTSSSNRTITLGGNNTDANAITGAIVNNASGTNPGIIVNKANTGKWILSGNNTYTGRTVVLNTGGTLQFAKTASLYNGNTANWTKTNITVNTGGTLALNVGGSSEFTTGDVTTLLANLTGVIASNGLRGGSSIAFDTTNAAGGIFTVADPLANTTGTSSGSLGVTKLGANTLVLTGNNTYTGNTTVTAGTLGLTGSSASPISLAAGTVLQLDLASPVTSNSTLSFAGNATVSVIGTPVSATTYNLFTGSAISGSPALSAPIAGFTLSNNGTVLQLVPSGGGGDTTKPIITLNGNATLTVNMGTTYTDAGATATDETAPANPTVTTSGSVNTAVPGIYVLSFDAVDTAGNTALTVTRTVTVVDATAPVITLLGSASVSVDWGSTYSDAGATAADNYDASVTVTTSGTVNTAKPGTYTLTYNASDVALNAATPVTRTVTVAIANPTTVDANGYTPLLRYALGANGPGDTVAAPVTNATTTELSLTAVVRTDDPKLTVVGTTRTDLITGNWTTTGVSGSPAGSGTLGDQVGVTTGERRVYTVNTASKTFLRLEATLAP